MPQLPWKTKSLLSRLQRFYRSSMLFRLQQRLKGKTLHWSLFLAISCLALGGLLGLHCYLHSHLYAVKLDGLEIGLVRDPGDVEQFVGDITCSCSNYYHMDIFPEQAITIDREYRPGEVEDLQAARSALMQQLNFLTDAVMVTVDGVPVVPVSTKDGVERVADLVCLPFVSAGEEVELLEVELLEDISGVECTVSPEEVYSPEQIVDLLTEPERDDELLFAARETMASRMGRNGAAHGPGLTVPVVHVRSVEQITVQEETPFNTSYTNNSKMYAGESRVVSPGERGLQEVTYRVIRENGSEQSRETLSRKVIREPKAQVVERGTMRRFAWPLAVSGRISQRFHAGHRGIDIAVPLNTSVLAAESGVVIISGWGSSQGNYIVINHGDYYTLYLHHNTNLVSAGQRVSRGQTIARSGSTGNSTGPHLHFEIRRSIGSTWGGWNTHPAINPLQFF